MNSFIIYMKIFVVVCLCIRFVQPASKKCTHLKKELSQSQSQYVQCCTNYAVSVELCTKCQDKYINMTQTYKALRDYPHCKEYIFNQDRLNLIEMTETFLLHVWQTAFCDDCFFGNHSEIFKNKTSTFHECLDKNKKDNKTQCSNCLKEYEDLNKFYKTLDEKNNGQVCYEMQDAMNKTRIWWSKNCSKREIRITSFIITTCCLTLLPIGFYIGAVLFTRRNERKTQYLHFNNADDDEHTTQHRQQDDQDSLVIDDAVSRATLRSATTNSSLSSASSIEGAAKPPTANFLKPALYDSDDDDDDDDSPPPYTPVPPQTT